jgi:hypothetical protein
MMQNDSRSGEFWDGTKMSLLGIRENTAVAPLESIV